MSQVHRAGQRYCISLAPRSTDKPSLKDSALNTASLLTDHSDVVGAGSLAEVTSGAIDSQPVESNRVTTIGGENAVPFLANGLLPVNGHAGTTETLDLLEPSISTTQATGDPAVQLPISDVREHADLTRLGGFLEPEEGKQMPASVNSLVSSSGLSGSNDLQAELGPSFTTGLLQQSENQMDLSVSLEQASYSEHVELLHRPAVVLVEGLESEAQLNPADSPVTKASEAPLLDQATQLVAMRELLPSSEDHVMQDAPQSPGKMARSRDDEDDDDEGPAQKRLRAETDGREAPEFKIPDLPQAATQPNDVTSDAALTTDAATTTDATGTTAQTSGGKTIRSSLPITKSQHKFLLKGVQNLRRNKNAAAFTAPVDIVALKIPNYPDIVKKPMDLRTMEEKLKSGGYSAVDDYVADFNQIVENTVAFNGPEHPVTIAAHTLKESFDKQMSNLPPPDIAEPPRPEKKAKTPAAPPQPKAAPPRRESRSSLGKARSPTAAGSLQTFALGPQGVPLIRRDSMATDGRPKREIHPPAPRDLPYSNQKPKKKKYQWELRFCQEVLNEMKKPKYSTIGFAFHNPVDPVALNIPTYHAIIKKPMDLGTIEKKLKEGQYENAKEFEADIRLMFANCYKFNPEADAVYGMGKQYEGIFDHKWAEKRQWIEEHAPASGPQSPGSSPESDEEDEEDDDEEEEEETDELAMLQKKIAAMSKQVENLTKKKASPPVMPKKAAKNTKATKPAPKKGGSMGPTKSDRKEVRPKKAKIPYVTYEQKQDISNRINTLPEARMATALTIIRDNMPNLKVRHNEYHVHVVELANSLLR